MMCFIEILGFPSRNFTFFLNGAPGKSDRELLSIHSKSQTLYFLVDRSLTLHLSSCFRIEEDMSLERLQFLQAILKWKEHQRDKVKQEVG